MNLKARVISHGTASGELLVSKDPISFYGGVNPDTGIVVERGHALEGISIAGKVLYFPRGKGSTVGSYTLYRLKKNNLAPKAIINAECEPIVAVGAIISDIPLVDKIDSKKLESYAGKTIKVNANKGVVSSMNE